MNWSMLWPVLLIVMSNTVYNITQKSTPDSVHPFAALTVTYLVAAALSAAIFLTTSGISSVLTEAKKLNWASFALGIAIVGLEVGYIFLYRVGWKVSAGSLVCNISLAAVLVIVGMMLYRETITPRQIAGMVLCVGGLVLLAK